MRNFFVSVRGIEQGGAPQCASKAPVGLCLARGRFPYGSYRTNAFPLWGKLSPWVTDEGVTSGHFPLIRRASAPPSPQGRRLLRRGGVTPPYGAIENRCTVGAGHAPPATVYYNEYNWLVCRGGIYAARCSHTKKYGIPGKPHGTVKTVPYKPARNGSFAHNCLSIGYL